MPRTSGRVSVVETLIAIGDLKQARTVATNLPEGDDKIAALEAIATAEAKQAGGSKGGDR